MSGRSPENKPLGSLPAPRDFSLVLGGPLFQLLRRAHLSDDALRLVRLRIIIGSLIVWLPLLVLSTLEGKVLRGTATVPFLLDLEVHVRFLLTMPLLLAAELIVHERMQSVVKVFLERHLIPDGASSRFDDAIESAFRLRNSVVAELLLIALVYGVGILILWRQHFSLDAATWYATGRAKLSLAGMWYGYVSLPIFQFLLCRWYLRLVIWSRFLWQVSRIELSLIPTHPDRVGGLGFLSNTVYAFTLLAVAHGTLLGGMLANRIFFLGASLAEYKIEIGVLVAFVLCLVIGPLLVFGSQLARMKRVGLREYGTLAEDYVRQFDDKWLRGGAGKDESILGSADLQSLADLNNSFDVVRTIRLIPVTKDTVFRIVLATLAPIIPLALTMMPLEELLKTLVGVLF